MKLLSNIVFLFALLSCSATTQQSSICFGTSEDGYLVDGWKLPSDGENFSAYSFLGSIVGRTYVHSDIHKVVLATYSELFEILPNTVFVYGETGKKSGGEFDPHKTHRNGLSVDFMVPVIDSSRQSVPLPTNVLNKWGYDLEFDSAGQLGDIEIEIDFEVMAEHIFQLHRIAQENGIRIRRVIFDPQLQTLLHDTARWPYLDGNIGFSKRRSWVRHDEHYHVDFSVQCQTAV